MDTPTDVGYFDVGHSSFFDAKNYRNKKLSSLPKNIQEQILENIDKDQIWYIYYDFSIKVLPALTIDRFGNVRLNSHSGYNAMAKGRYDKEKHAVSLTNMSYDKNPKRQEYLNKKIYQILDDTFGNPVIYEDD